MRISGVPFYPAHSTNYTKGRERPIRKITIHHSAGWENTLRYLWADPARNGSSHFWVGNQPNQVEQYVDTDDTAWTNSNWVSNTESITIETRGDWRNGYYDQQTLNNLELLLRPLRKAYPNAIITYHRTETDASRPTVCPADLLDKGIARRVWDNVTAWLNPPTPAPTPQPALTYKPITPKRVRLIRTANLWNFNFTDWNKAQAVATHGAGHIIDVVAIARNSLGGEYYMTAYSYNEGKIRATNGFNIKDCEDYVPAVTQPPTVEPKWEPMQNPRKMRLMVASKVTNLDNGAETGDLVPAGTDISLVELKTTKPGEVWARSQWARDNGKNWGIRFDRFAEVPAPTPEPPREPVPEPPIDVDPTKPGSGDVKIDKGIVRAFLDALQALINQFRGDNNV